MDKVRSLVGVWMSLAKRTCQNVSVTSSKSELYPDNSLNVCETYDLKPIHNKFPCPYRQVVPCILCIPWSYSRVIPWFPPAQNVLRIEDHRIHRTHRRCFLPPKRHNKAAFRVFRVFRGLQIKLKAYAPTDKPRQTNPPGMLRPDWSE